MRRGARRQARRAAARAALNPTRRATLCCGAALNSRTLNVKALLFFRPHQNPPRAGTPRRASMAGGQRDGGRGRGRSRTGGRGGRGRSGRSGGERAAALPSSSGKALHVELAATPEFYAAMQDKGACPAMCLFAGCRGSVHARAHITGVGSVGVVAVATPFCAFFRFCFRIAVSHSIHTTLNICRVPRRVGGGRPGRRHAAGHQRAGAAQLARPGGPHLLVQVRGRAKRLDGLAQAVLQALPTRLQHRACVRSCG